MTKLAILAAVEQQGSVAIVQKALALAEADRGISNAFCALNPNALADAAASDARRRAGASLGPLDGVPIAIKDNMLAAGMRATWGAELFADFIPDADELPVAKLRKAGAVILGKTNTPAFSARGYTRNALWGDTRNPLNLALTPGGSSGGSAAALAAGIVDFALGTDGGGSTRRPAAHCGLVGLKPSIGYIARADGFLPLMHDLEVVGPMARDMNHLRLLCAVLSGPDPKDPRSNILQRPVLDKPLRIGYFDAFPGHPVAAGIRAALKKTAQKLAVMGHRVEPVTPFFDIDLAGRLQGQITDCGFAALAKAHPSFATLAPAEYQAQAQAAITSAELMQLLNEISRFRADIGIWFDQYDILLTPAVAAQAWPVGDDYPAQIDGQVAGPRGHAIFTGWVNVAGHPALSIPSGEYADGLPVGVQLVAGFGGDTQLLALGQAFEQAR